VSSFSFSGTSTCLCKATLRTRYFTFKNQGQAYCPIWQRKEAVIAILERGQFFGEGCLNGQTLRIATATAMEDCLITATTETRNDHRS
jgi:hypothetical protein